MNKRKKQCACRARTFGRVATQRSLARAKYGPSASSRLLARCIGGEVCVRCLANTGHQREQRSVHQASRSRVIGREQRSPVVILSVERVHSLIATTPHYPQTAEASRMRRYSSGTSRVDGPPDCRGTVVLYLCMHRANTCERQGGKARL